MPSDDPDKQQWQKFFLSVTDEYRNQLKQRGTELGLTPWDISILEAMWYGHGQCDSMETFIRNSHGSFRKASKFLSDASIERCFQADWIRIVTPEFENELRDELHAGGYVLAKGLFDYEPVQEIQGESVAGIISFGRHGPEVYKHFWDFQNRSDISPHYTIGYDIDGTKAIFGETLDACRSCLNNVDDWCNSSFEHPFVREPAVKIGRWCDRWWQRFESGYRIRYSCVSQLDGP